MCRILLLVNGGLGWKTAWIDLYHSWSGLMKGPWKKSLVWGGGQGGRGRSKHKPPPQPGVCLITYSLKGFRPPFFLLSASQQRQKAVAEGCAGLMPVILRHSEHQQPIDNKLQVSHPSCGLRPVYLHFGVIWPWTRRHLTDAFPIPLSLHLKAAWFSSHLSALMRFKPPFTHLICLLQISPLHLPLPYSRTTYLGSLLLKESDPDSSDHQHTVPTQLPPNSPSSALHLPHPPYHPPLHPAQPSGMAGCISVALRSPIQWKEMFLY